MPNWKKIITSGSDATLNSISGSSFVYSGGDIIAQQNLKSIFSSGDEGGEIFLSKPQTNTSITGSGVTIDSYQNKIRIFENGGTNRGGYYDITALGAGVSTNLIPGGGGILTLTPQSPLPSGVPTGTFAVSSSTPPKPYFWDGSNWNALY